MEMSRIPNRAGPMASCSEPPVDSYTRDCLRRLLLPSDEPHRGLAQLWILDTRVEARGFSSGGSVFEMV